MPSPTPSRPRDYGHLHPYPIPILIPSPTPPQIHPNPIPSPSLSPFHPYLHHIPITIPSPPPFPSPSPTHSNPIPIPSPSVQWLRDPPPASSLPGEHRSPVLVITTRLQTVTKRKTELNRFCVEISNNGKYIFEQSLENQCFPCGEVGTELQRHDYILLHSHNDRRAEAAHSPRAHPIAQAAQDGGLGTGEGTKGKRQPRASSLGRQILWDAA